MGEERTQAPQKASPQPLHAENVAAQAKTSAHSSSYYPQGLSMSGASSADDIPLTRDNLLYLQRTMGNRSVVQLLQKKGKISKPGDQYEREADRVAEQVVSTPSQASVAGGTSTPQISPMPAQEECSECRTEIQRQPASEEDQRKRPEEETGLQMKEAEGADPLQLRMGKKAEPCTCCEKGCEKEGHIQAKEDGEQTPAGVSEVESEIAGSHGGGQPLPEATRDYFESRFGRDFGQVRVHTDSSAIDMNRALNARAFTHEDHIYFNSGDNGSPSVIPLSLSQDIHSSNSPLNLSSYHLLNMIRY